MKHSKIKTEACHHIMKSSNRFVNEKVAFNIMTLVGENEFITPAFQHHVVITDDMWYIMRVTKL